MSRLAVELARDGIHVEVVDDTAEFVSKMTESHYDFFITDWFDERESKRGGGAPSGAMLVNMIRREDKASPIFVVSQLPDKIDQTLLNLARPVFLRSKDATVPWMAYDIRETLADMGLLVDKQRVFIIYGHDARAQGTLQAVEDWLKSKGAKPVLLESRRSRDGILPDLMREIKASAAFISICTPDDRCTSAIDPGSTWYQPRQNVLFEMGIVYGLSRNAQKLTVIQRWTNGRPDEQAQLPSDWGGYLTLRFVNNANEIFPKLEHRLKELGVILV